MTTQAVHHAPYRSTVLAATATALVIGGLAAAGFALSSTQDGTHPVPPARVQSGPLPGVHDFTAPGEGVDGASPLLGQHALNELKVRRAAIPRG
jgi:hypothetical protein